ncbi:DsbA family oxidoreductase [Sanguibacter antarcticus]|uniref:DsbA family oxidoreductase n=1 Tax=Sanguibacter antarcticus TaxID=372484 RepID=UPI000BF85EB8|nr:DsbA family oxidoreductase [Sanguibacter antarcticus]
MNATLKIDIWSDIACPWCYIGKRRLEEALRRLDAADSGIGVEIEYHSFELSPDTPVDFEGPILDYFADAKGISKDQAQQMLAQVTEVAAGEGLDFRYDILQHTKTLKAHELLHHAKAHGRQIDMKERLLKAYFVEGGYVGRVDDLVRYATEIGLDADEARAALEDGRYGADVAADIAQARGYGIQGVPFFVIDTKYGVSGAQDPAVFVEVLEKAAADQQARAGVDVG